MVSIVGTDHRYVEAEILVRLGQLINLSGRPLTSEAALSTTASVPSIASSATQAPSETTTDCPRSSRPRSRAIRNP